MTFPIIQTMKFTSDDAVVTIPAAWFENNYGYYVLLACTTDAYDVTGDFPTPPSIAGMGLGFDQGYFYDYDLDAPTWEDPPGTPYRIIYEIAASDGIASPNSVITPNVTWTFSYAVPRTFLLVIFDTNGGTLRGIQAAGAANPNGGQAPLGNITTYGLEPNAPTHQWYGFVVNDESPSAYTGPGAVVDEFEVGGLNKISVIDLGNIIPPESSQPLFYTGLESGAGNPTYGLNVVLSTDPFPFYPPNNGGGEGGRIPCPPLRHRQRDDIWETPRARTGPNASHPTSAGEMDRRGWVNTYDGPGPCWGNDTSTCA